MLLLLTLVFSTLVQAQDTPSAPDLDEDETARTEDMPDQTQPKADAEIIVRGELEVRQAKTALNQQLVDLGYTPRRRKDGRTVYIHEDGWRQKLIMDDDGYVYFRQRPPHITGPPETGLAYDDWPILPWGTCILFPAACVNVGSIPRNQRLKLKDKERTMVASQDELVRYADALAGEALAVRLYEEVPDLLDSIWLEGEHLEQPELELPDAASRRKAILEFWISRTDNAYGDAVREVVEAYMVYVVNDSSEPFTAEEIAWANETRRCERALVLWEY